mgnify:CR=1 FL=1
MGFDEGNSALFDRIDDRFLFYARLIYIRDSLLCFNLLNFVINDTGKIDFISKRRCTFLDCNMNYGDCTRFTGNVFKRADGCANLNILADALPASEFCDQAKRRRALIDERG